MLSLIVAASENNVIGKNNRLLWHLPADMKFFKNTTWALPVIMGRKTFESLGKPLMGRYNIVITSNEDWHAEGVKVVSNIQQAIEAADVMKSNETMVIGGGQIYKETLPFADRVYLTRVHTTLEGDTFFPALNSAEWKLTSANHFYKDDKHAFDYSFEIWTREP